MQKKIKVLITPLNWGLGHATRCIPIIKILEKHNCDIVIATDGPPLYLLKKEFPLLKVIELPSYSIKYSKKIPMALAIAIQMPKILINIGKERKFVKYLQIHEKFDIIMTDCRFGCYIHGKLNIYITHQVLIRFPEYLKLLEPLGAFFHKMVWQKFDHVWILDRVGKQSLSGELGHTYHNRKIRYIGISSRFNYQNVEKKSIDYCFLLSGPEPQRTLLEKAILRYNWPENNQYHLIRGLPESVSTLNTKNNWVVSNHLSTNELQRVLCTSKKIICRSGYSTIMDLFTLGLKAILIPTPGQPEQEYLARYISQKYGFHYQLQNNLNYEKLLKIDYPPDISPFHKTEDNDLLKNAILKALRKIY